MAVKGGNLSVLTPAQVEDIHHGSLEVLEETGVVVPHRPLLDLCREAGAFVDFSSEVVRFPGSLVENSLRKAPSRWTWHGRNPARAMHLGGDNVYFIGASTMLSVIDLEGNRRPATLQDARDFCRLKDALENVYDGYCVVHPTDVPDHAAHAYSLYTQFANTEKPWRARMQGRQVARDCIRLASIVAGGDEELRRKPNILVVINTVSPLANAPDQMEALVEYARAGLPIIVSPEVQAGATGPATLAGTLAVQTAEILAAITLIQLVNPGNPVGYGTVSSVLDMRRGSSPRAHRRPPFSTSPRPRWPATTTSPAAARPASPNRSCWTCRRASRAVLRPLWPPWPA